MYQALASSHLDAGATILVIRVGRHPGTVIEIQLALEIKSGSVATPKILLASKTKATCVIAAAP